MKFVSPMVLGAAIIAVSISLPGQASAAPPPDLSRLTPLCQPDERSAEVLDQYLAAYNKHDIVEAGALTTHDFTRYSVTTARPQSKPDWSDMWVRFNDAFPDERWQVASTKNCGDTVSVRVIETGTFSRPWVFPDGHTELPTGHAYRADSVIVFRLDDNRMITSYMQFTTPGFLAVDLTPDAFAAIVRNGY